MSGEELRGENVAELLREYADSHPARRVLLSAEETRALLDERDALRAQVERVRALADEWDEKKRPGMVGIAKGIRDALDGPNG